MIRKLSTIELQLSANAVTPNGSVVLTANLSDLELEELLAQGGSLVFGTDDGPLDDVDEDRPDLRTITLELRDEPVGSFTATVEAKVPGNDDPIAKGEATIYVIDETTFQIVSTPSAAVDEGTPIKLQVTGPDGVALDFLDDADLHFEWDGGKRGTITTDPANPRSAAIWNTFGMNGGINPVTAKLVDKHSQSLVRTGGALAATGAGTLNPVPHSRGDMFRVALQRSSVGRTQDQPFWSLIRSCTNAINSTNYATFMDKVLCPEPGSTVGAQSVIVGRLSRNARDLQTLTYGVGAYDLLKTATQIFLLLECGGCHAEIKGLNADEESTRLGETVTLPQIRERLGVYLSSGHLPYIDRVLRNAFRGQKEIARPHCYGVLTSKVQVPCLLELIWSYWHEEGMLVQSIGALTRRFQNMRAPGVRDPLAHLEIDPLRPLNHLLWGYIQDEWNLLTVKRRAYEYDHHYGLTISGKAVPSIASADSRSKFLEAFHHLLHRCSIFYKEDNDTTVIADGFPLLNALKEVHLVLAQGAHNQFGDLPWTARSEMLIQQWLLSRPEIRDFLQSRAMVPYKEPWMAQVDTMKTLQGWSDITVTHFRDLGVYGEQILLSVRYGDWIDVNDEDAAKNWARYWRPEIQGYLHGYRAATGVDLTNPDTVDFTMPTVHLQKRLTMQRAR